MLPAHASLQEKLTLLTSGAKTLALRAALGTRISTQERTQGSFEHESVEIYLHYEQALRDEL